MYPSEMVARRAYCVESFSKSMCVRSFVRPSVRPSVRSSVRHAHRIRLDLVTRNGLLPLVQRSSTPKTDRFEDDRHAHRIIVIEIELLRSSSSVASVVGFSILSPSGHPALRVLSSIKPTEIWWISMCIYPQIPPGTTQTLKNTRNRQFSMPTCGLKKSCQKKSL